MRASAGGPPRYRRPTPPENHAPAKTPRPAASAPSSRPHSSIRTTLQTAANPPASPDRHCLRYARDGTTPRFPAPRRKHMTRPCQIIRRRAIGDRGTDSREPVGGGNPRRHPARRLDRHRKRRTETARIARHHRRQGQTPCRIRFHTQTDDPAARTDHQRQLSHRHFRRGKYRIALIPAVGIVHQRHPATGSQRRNRRRHPARRNLAAHSFIKH